eukprot:30628-Pelagococcus_subviridis.AAC.3
MWHTTTHLVVHHSPPARSTNKLAQTPQHVVLQELQPLPRTERGVLVQNGEVIARRRELRRVRGRVVENLDEAVQHAIDEPRRLRGLASIRRWIRRRRRRRSRRRRRGENPATKRSAAAAATHGGGKEQRLRGRAAAVAGHRGSQRGGDEIRERFPRVRARATREKRGEVPRSVAQKVQEPQTRGRGSLQERGHGVAPRHETLALAHRVMRAEVDVAQKLRRDSHAEHRALVLLLLRAHARVGTAAVAFVSPAPSAGAAERASSLRFSRVSALQRALHELLNEREVLPAEDVPVEDELKVLRHDLAANFARHRGDGHDFVPPRSDRLLLIVLLRLLNDRGRGDARRRRKNLVGVHRVDALVKQHVRAVRSVVLDDPTSGVSDFVVAAGAAAERGDVHPVLTPERVRLEARDVVRLDSLIVVHVPSLANFRLPRRGVVVDVRPGRGFSFANVRVVMTRERGTRVHDDADEFVLVVIERVNQLGHGRGRVAGRLRLRRRGLALDPFHRERGHVETHRKLEPILHFQALHRLVIELEPLEVDAQRVRQLLETDSLHRIDVTPTLLAVPLVIRL